MDRKPQCRVWTFQRPVTQKLPWNYNKNIFLCRMQRKQVTQWAFMMWRRRSFRWALKTRMVTLWWLRLLSPLMQQNDLAAMKYSEMKWPGLDPAEWPCLCWQQPFDPEDRGQDKSSVLLYPCVCLCVSDTPCDVVRCLWPPGTPRQPAGTGMWRRLKDLSHLEPSSSSSSATPPVSLSVPESYAPQVDDFKAYCKPKATRKESKTCKTDRSERGCFLADDKSIAFRSIRHTCKHQRVDWFKICILALSFCNRRCGCEALVCLVLVF